MKEPPTDKYFDHGHLNPEAIALITDALLLHKEDLLPAGLQVHAEECQQCRKEIMEVFSIAEKDVETKTIENHPFFGNVGNNKTKSKLTLMPYFIRIAAIFLVMVGIGGGIYYIAGKKMIMNNPQQTAILNDTLKQDEENIGQTEQNMDSIATISGFNKSLENNALALNMEKSVFFENLMASEYRSADLEILSPAIAQQMEKGKEIKFEFKGEVADPLTIIIYSNKEKKIFEQEIQYASLYSFNNQLPSGLYYWKLLQGDNLAYVGKFVVK